MRKLIERLRRLLGRNYGTPDPKEQVLSSSVDDLLIFDPDSYSAAIKNEENIHKDRGIPPFDHDAKCREIVGIWLETGVSIVTLTPDDIFYSGQLSESPGPISLEHKILEYDAGLWLSRHVMYASCYTDFSSAVGSDQIRSKYLFKVRPTFDFKVILFADGAPHPAPMGRQINGLNSDLYIAQQWPRLLNELCSVRPEFSRAHGHLRESKGFTSELWLYNTKILTVDKALNVTHEKHWDRVTRYGNGNEQSENRAKLALFENPSPSLPQCVQQEQ